MPTREQLESALINADKAGDYAAAKAIANELRATPEQQPVLEQGADIPAVPVQAAPSPAPVQSNQVAPPIDIKGAIQDRIKQKAQWSDLPGNIPGSAAKLGEGLAQVVTHPVETVKGLGNLALGAIDKAASSLEESVPEGLRNKVNAANNWIAENIGGLSEVPEGGTKDMPTYKGDIADAVGEFYASRYGSAEKAKNTLINDPVGAAADLATILSMGAGITSKIPGLSKLSQGMKVTSSAVNPLNIAGKAVSATVKPVAKKAYTWGAGTTTSSGAEAVAAGLKPTKHYTAAMRGKMSDEDVLNLARKSLGSLRNKRSDTYRESLAKISKVKKSIDISGVYKSADTWLKRFNVKKTPEGLDFSRSTLTGSAAKEAEEIYRMVKDWGAKAGDRTPSGLDILKRRIDDFYTEGHNSRAMAASLSKKVKGIIVKEVPEYAKMTAGYTKSSAAIRSVEQALLGKGGKGSADTALRKLAMAAREEKGFRRSLLDMMDEVTDLDVKGAVMGRAMNPAWSNRLGPMMTAAGLGFAGATNPWLLILLPAASPRAIGELTNALGVTGKIASKLKRIPSIAPIVAAQAGNLPIYETNNSDNQSKR